MGGGGGAASTGSATTSGGGLCRLGVNSGRSVVSDNWSRDVVASGFLGLDSTAADVSAGAVVSAAPSGGDQRAAHTITAKAGRMVMMSSGCDHHAAVRLFQGGGCSTQTSLCLICSIRCSGSNLRNS